MKQGLGKRFKVPKKPSDTPLIRHPSQKNILTAAQALEKKKYCKKSLT